jgi:cobalt transporter subunit CbtB
MYGLTTSASITAARRDALRYGVVAILLGIIFIGITGFAHPEALHNAAHNTRHAMNFPCH